MPDLYVHGSWTGALPIGRRQTLCRAEGTLAATAGGATPEEDEVPGWVCAHAETALHDVDASLFPHIAYDDVYAPGTMVAEETADLPAVNTALRASGVPFHRHRSGSGPDPRGDRRNGPTHQARKEQP